MRIILFYVISLFMLVSCSSEKSGDQSTQEKQQQDNNQQVTSDTGSALNSNSLFNQPPSNQPPANQPPTEAPAQVDIPAGADGIVHHYICKDLCSGGFSDQAGVCPVCGNNLAHNTAFHAQDAPPPANTNAQTPPPNQQTPPPTPPQSPAQNAAGVWHFTCPNGCAGGGGTASPCSKCGSTLVHNQGYHQ